MARLRIKPDEVLKFGMYAIQCETVDGRAWQLNHRFNRDDPALTSTIRALKARGEIDTSLWFQVSSLGSLRRVG